MQHPLPLQGRSLAPFGLPKLGVKQYVPPGAARSHRERLFGIGRARLPATCAVTASTAPLSPRVLQDAAVHRAWLQHGARSRSSRPTLAPGPRSGVTSTHLPAPGAGTAGQALPRAPVERVKDSGAPGLR